MTISIHYVLHLCYSISQLVNLQILDMSWNKLSDNLPDDMFTFLQSLRELDISNCELSTLPKRCVLYVYIKL